jgi:hypothetical protein
MGDARHHAGIAGENLKGSIDEFKKKRFSNVGLLFLRALEQMIEACAAKEDLHFHEHPRTAHRNRRNWLEGHHPDLLTAWDQLWGIYGALGYGGLNGERAEQALTILKACVAELGRREEIAIGGL